MPLIVRQQVQPPARQHSMHSQHLRIIAQHCSSPLVQVQQQPFAVSSHVQRPQQKLPLQMHWPFNRHVNPHTPSAAMRHKF